MQLKHLAVLAPLIAFACASPIGDDKRSADVVVAEPRAELVKDADAIWLWKKAELEKDADAIWLWKKRDEAEKRGELVKDADAVWLWKKAKLEKDADAIWLWKKARLEKDADAVWLWKKREELEKRGGLVKDADDVRQLILEAHVVYFQFAVQTAYLAKSHSFSCSTSGMHIT